MPPRKPDTLVRLGRIGAPHGVRGWVKLHSFTSPMTNITGYRQFRVSLPDGVNTLEVDEIREHGKTLIAHVVGYDSPEAARVLTGTELKVDTEQLPPLAEGDFYWFELEGLAVISLSGQRLGHVRQLMETGANDVMIVAPDENSIDDRERLIPWLPDRVIRRVALDEGLLEVDWEPDWL